MKVRVEELSPIERKLSIEVESALVAEELSRAYAALNRRVKVAGFRPGKVPRRILEQRFREQVEDDVVQRVVERAYLEAIRQHQVEAVSNPAVSPSPLKENAPFAFEARVQVKPKLDPKDYKGLPLSKVEVKVEEAQVAEQLENLRKGAARLEPVEDREVVRSGDLVQVDYVATCEGKDFPGSRAENVLIEAAPGELLRGFAPTLEGTKVGGSCEVDYDFPADYSVEALGGKRARFTLKLKGIKVKVVPELNDELAQEMGAGSTLEELRARVRADLERSLRAKAEAEQRDELIKRLLEKNPFEVPHAMVDRATDLMLRGALRAMAERGVDPRMLNLDFGKLREEMRPRAEVEVKATLLFEAIAEKEGLQVSEEELDGRIEKLAEEEKVAVSQLKKRFKRPEERSGLSLRLREEKTVEFLKGQARYEP